MSYSKDFASAKFQITVAFSHKVKHSVTDRRLNQKLAARAFSVVIAQSIECSDLHARNSSNVSH
jgi:hypothetical protein